MKTAKLVLITMAFTVPVLLHAQEQSTAQAQAKGKATEWDRLTPLERARKVSRIKGSRKVDIQSVKQTMGIKTGMVIAYGHLIPPPYKVESIGDKVLINGIQVIPSLVVERDVKPIPIPADKKVFAQKKYDFNQDIKKKYYTQVLFKDKKELQSEILVYAKSQPIVEDVRWGTDILFVKYAGDMGFSTMINLPGTTPEKPWPNRSKEARDSMVTYITKGIGTGCILIDSDGGVSPGCGDKRTVNEVMQDSKLSKDEKIERLAKWGNYETAMDIVDNYDSQEWKTEGAQK